MKSTFNSVFILHWKAFRYSHLVKEQLVPWTELNVNEKGHKDGLRIVIKHKKV